VVQIGTLPKNGGESMKSEIEMREKLSEMQEKQAQYRYDPRIIEDQKRFMSGYILALKWALRDGIHG
jgi:hypothetical protein